MGFLRLYRFTCTTEIAKMWNCSHLFNIFTWECYELMACILHDSLVVLLLFPPTLYLSNSIIRMIKDTVSSNFLLRKVLSFLCFCFLSWWQHFLDFFFFWICYDEWAIKKRNFLWYRRKKRTTHLPVNDRQPIHYDKRLMLVGIGWRPLPSSSHFSP